MLAPAGIDTETLIDGEPDILADFPGVFSVARFRYPHGSRYDVTFTDNTDGHDRAAAFGLLPEHRTFLTSEDTNMHGVEYENTLSFWAAL